MLLIIISCRSTYQVTYQLCHQTSVNFPPLPAYWSSPVANKYFLTKQVCVRCVITSYIPYLGSLFFFCDQQNIKDNSKCCISLTYFFMIFRGLIFVYLQHLIHNKPIMFYWVVLVIFYRKRAFNGQNIRVEKRKWVKDVKL